MLIVSIRCSSSNEIWDLCEKSNRSFVGATREPLWSTWSPRTSRKPKLRMWVAVWLFRRGHRRSYMIFKSRRYLDGEKSTTYFIVRWYNFIPQFKLPILQTSSMQHITIIHLDIFHLKMGNAVDYDTSSVVFLSTSLGVETRLVEDNTNSSVWRNVASRFKKWFFVENGLYCSSDVPEIWLWTMLSEV